MAQTRSSTIFVGNVPYDAGEDDLKEIFGRAGTVTNLRMVYDKDTRQPKGYGFCDFADPDSAVKAMKELSDVECCGRRLRIDLADNSLSKGKGKGKGDGQFALGDAPRGGPPSMAPPSGRPPNQAGNSLPAGFLNPELEAKLREEKNEPTPEAVAAEVSAHTETVQIVSAMSKVELTMCLGAMQRLAEESPEASRALLQENPQLCYALLQAQMLLGLDTHPLLPPCSDEVQHLKMAAMRTPAGMMQGMAGMLPRQMMPGMLPSMGIPGMLGLGGLPSMPFAGIPTPPPRPPPAAMAIGMMKAAPGYPRPVPY